AAPAHPRVGARLGDAGGARRQAGQEGTEPESREPATGVEVQAPAGAEHLGEVRDAVGLAHVDPPQRGGRVPAGWNLAIARIARSGVARSGVAGAGVAGAGVAGAGVAGAGVAGAGVAGAGVAGAGVAGAGVAGAGVAGAGVAGAGVAGAGVAGARVAGVRVAGAGITRARIARTRFLRIGLVGAGIARTRFVRAGFARPGFVRRGIAGAGFPRTGIVGSGSARSRRTRARLAAAGLPARWRIRRRQHVVVQREQAAGRIPLRVRPDIGIDPGPDADGQRIRGRVAHTGTRVAHGGGIDAGEPDIVPLAAARRGVVPASLDRVDRQRRAIVG